MDVVVVQVGEGHDVESVAPGSLQLLLKRGRKVDAEPRYLVISVPVGVIEEQHLSVLRLDEASVGVALGVEGDLVCHGYHASV